MSVLSLFSFLVSSFRFCVFCLSLMMYDVSFSFAQILLYRGYVNSLIVGLIHLSRMEYSPQILYMGAKRVFVLGSIVVL